jgi:hypothetical protein
MESKAIYPKMDIRSILIVVGEHKERETYAITHLRKKHKGKWYLQKFRYSICSRKYILPEQEIYAISEIKDLIHDAVYKGILFTIVDPKFMYKLSSGKDVYLFPLDDDQREEGERLLR